MVPGAEPIAFGRLEELYEDLDGKRQVELARRVDELF